jgi:NAD(P) transhydrogenase
MVLDSVSNQSKANKSEYDLIVIGSGPAGIQAAVQAAKLKKSVCIIEKMPNQVGGAWIHTGTLPSKTIRESLEAIHAIKHHAGQPWVDRVISDLSTAKLYRRAHKVSSEEESLVRRYTEKNQIEICNGFAAFEDQHTIRVTPTQGLSYTIKGKNFVIATGSRPRRPDNIPFDGWRVVDSDEVLRLESLPSHILIYGAGVIGCEYACIFGALGIQTTLVDSRDRLLAMSDAEVVKSLEKAMMDMGIKIKFKQDLKNIITKGPKVAVQLTDETIETDVLFFAAGRISNSENMGLEKIGIRVDGRGIISVNDEFQTNIPHIYAAHLIFNYPTLAEASLIAAFNALNKIFPDGKILPPEC